jgi:hypothetical protein
MAAGMEMETTTMGPEKMLCNVPTTVLTMELPYRLD